MAQAARLNLRMQKELKLLLTDPPPGASFPFLSADSELSSLSTIHARIEGPEGSVYAKGVFEVKIQIPERYPFQPPSVTFVTPIYHPNIDSGGRICLDILNLPPKGAWQPSLNISTVLTSIGLLLSEPNADDGLMCEASREYKYNRQTFDQKARSMTQKYAKIGSSGDSCSTQGTQILISSLTEFVGSQKSRLEVDDFVSSHPSGISRKLSLESSSSTKNRDNDGELNEMETKGKRKEMGINLDEGNLKQEKLCGSRQKLSLEYSSYEEKNIGHEKENVGANQSSLCKRRTISMAPSGSNVPEHNIHSQQKQNHHETFESINGSTSTSSEQPCQFNQKNGSLDAFLVTNSNNEKMHIASQLWPPQSLSKASHRASSIEMPINGSEIEPHKDFINRLGNGSTESICRRIRRAGRKLSLGSKGSSRGQEKDDKENVAHVHNPVPVSSPKSSCRKSGIGGKLSRAPFTQLLGSNESNSKLLSHSEKLAIDSPMSLPLKQDPGFEDKQSNLHHDAKVSEENEQQKLEALPLPEAVIVLDSEDSEEERDGALRSKLSLARKCRGKWRTKA